MRGIVLSATPRTFGLATARAIISNCKFCRFVVHCYFSTCELAGFSLSGFCTQILIIHLFFLCRLLAPFTGVKIHRISNLWFAVAQDFMCRTVQSDQLSFEDTRNLCCWKRWGKGISIIVEDDFIRWPQWCFISFTFYANGFVSSSGRGCSCSWEH